MSDILIRGMEMPKDIEPGLVIEFADGINGKRYARLWHYRHGGLTEWLEAISAAEAQPVVRGKWVNYGDEYHPDIKCCMCGQRKPILLGNFNFNFCPNCGADMRQDGEA